MNYLLAMKILYYIQNKCKIEAFQPVGSDFRTLLEASCLHWCVQIALLLSHHVFPSLFIYLCIYTLKLTKGVVLQNMHIQS